MQSEVARRATFDSIRYSQCWEDAEILLAGMDARAGQTCLSIASAGDNSLALLTCKPEKVVAIDLSKPQLYLTELKIAAFKALSHPELLCLLAGREGYDRLDLFNRCAPLLSLEARAFWHRSENLKQIEYGIEKSGRFERYFTLFRKVILPLVHSQVTVNELLSPMHPDEREIFFRRKWNTPVWRLLFKLFFSRRTMSLLGREPAFFKYASSSLSEFLCGSTKHALTKLDPSHNPYLQWILCGRFTTALPVYLQAEHFETIKSNISKIELVHASLESYLEEQPNATFDYCNLSDIFEYMDESNSAKLLQLLAQKVTPGGRLLYWNMLVPRSTPARFKEVLRPLTSLSQQLYKKNQAFFYTKLLIEERAS